MFSGRWVRILVERAHVLDVVWVVLSVKRGDGCLSYLRYRSLFQNKNSKVGAKKLTPFRDGLLGILETGISRSINNGQ